MKTKNFKYIVHCFPVMLHRWCWYSFCPLTAQTSSCIVSLKENPAKASNKNGMRSLCLFRSQTPVFTLLFVISPFPSEHVLAVFSFASCTHSRYGVSVLAQHHEAQIWNQGCINIWFLLAFSRQGYQFQPNTDAALASHSSITKLYHEKLLGYIHIFCVKNKTNVSASYWIRFYITAFTRF